MSRTPRPLAPLALGALLAVVLSEAPGHAGAAPYQRRWSTIAGGGAIPSRNLTTGYRLGGTIGQPVAGVRSAANHRLITGFWSGATGAPFLDVPDPPAHPPVAFRLVPPYPNPSHGATTLGFDLPVAADVAVRVLDVQGRQVRALDGGHHDAGARRLTWDGRDDGGAPLPRGLYFVHVDAGHDHGVLRLVLLPEGGAR